MPVDMITCRAARAISSRKGALVISPEDTLMVEMPKRSVNNTKLDESNGVERNSMPLERA
ncbi:hypothetical protein D3C72_2529920 [compost metagenome]